MGGRAALDASSTGKDHKKRRRQKKAKHRSYSNWKNGRHNSQSPSASSSSLSSYSSSSPSRYSSDTDSDSDSVRGRVRSKDSRSRPRREKHGGFRKRDHVGRKKDRRTSSHRIKVASKRHKLDSSSKSRQETERGRKRKKARRGCSSYDSASRSPSSDTSSSTCDSRSSSCTRSCSRRSRHRNVKTEGTRNESHGAGKYDNRVEITQDLDDFPSSHSYNSDDAVKKPESQDTKLPSSSSRKIVSHDLVIENNERELLEHRSDDDSHCHHYSIQEKEQGCPAEDIDSQYGSQVAEDSVAKLKSVVIAPAKATEDNDLELVLRQKALENLRKFRRENASSTIRSSIDVEDGQVQNRPEISSSDITGGGGKDRSLPEKPTQYTGQRLSSSGEKCVASAAQQKRTFPSGRSSNNEISPCGPMGNTVGNQPIKISDSPGIARTSSKLQLPNAHSLSASTLSGNVEHLSSGSTSLRKEGPDSSTSFCLEPESSNPCLFRQQMLVNRVSEEGTRPVSNVEEADAKEAGGPASVASSVPGQILCNNNKDKVKNEAPPEEQLEKKTMTVMRGGEMVQVSYKVYIPKKTPALARRQLQR